MSDSNDKWNKLNPKDCIPSKKPNKNNLYKDTKKDDEWVSSNSEWCGSCYNSYIAICKSVADAFDIYFDYKKKHWNEEALRKIVNKIYDDTKDDNYIDWLKENTRKLEVIIDCINTRFYQHDNCYKKEGELYPSEVSNKGHMRILTTLCSGLLKLYMLYERNLKLYNDKHNNKMSNILLDLNSECANNCKNILVNTESKDILEELKLSIKNIELLEGLKNSNIKLSNSKVENILKKYDIYGKKKSPKKKSKRSYNKNKENKRVKGLIKEHNREYGVKIISDYK
jgi:hypothetical protein